MDGGDSAGLAVSVWTNRLPEDTALQVDLPGEARRLTLRRLLDRLFPPVVDDRADTIARFDRRANPDLPACYAELLTLTEQWRVGLCRLLLTSGRGWGRPAHLDDPVSAHLQPPRLCRRIGVWDDAELTLTILPDYRPIDWAVAQGYAASRDHLLDWMQSCALLYFVDKHGCLPPLPANLSESDPCRPVISGLYRRRCLRPGGDGAVSEVAPAGREMIRALLAETESLIDSFDLFKDARWNEHTEEAEFDSGRGADLRVEAIIAEGLDPVRAVFLLRLYDGTLDPYADQWKRLVGDPACFDRLLEPVVNRALPPPPDAVLAAIMEDGYSLLEARSEAVAESQAQSKIRRRLLTQQRAGAFGVQH